MVGVTRLHILTTEYIRESLEIWKPEAPGFDNLGIRAPLIIMVLD